MVARRAIPSVQVVTGGKGRVPLGHIRNSGGMALCGRPATQDQLHTWGDDRIDCGACVRVRAAG